MESSENKNQNVSALLSLFEACSSADKEHFLSMLLQRADQGGESASTAGEQRPHAPLGAQQLENSSVASLSARFGTTSVSPAAATVPVPGNFSSANMNDYTTAPSSPSSSLKAGLDLYPMASSSLLHQELLHTTHEDAANQHFNGASAIIRQPSPAEQFAGSQSSFYPSPVSAVGSVAVPGVQMGYTSAPFGSTTHSPLPAPAWPLSVYPGVAMYHPMQQHFQHPAAFASPGGPARSLSLPGVPVSMMMAAMSAAGAPPSANLMIGSSSSSSSHSTFASSSSLSASDSGSASSSSMIPAGHPRQMQNAPWLGGGAGGSMGAVSVPFPIPLVAGATTPHRQVSHHSVAGASPLSSPFVSYSNLGSTFSHFPSWIIRVDFVAALPPELALEILSLLPPESMSSVATVSKTWSCFVRSDDLYQRMCARMGFSKPPIPTPATETAVMGGGALPSTSAKGKERVVPELAASDESGALQKERSWRSAVAWHTLVRRNWTTGKHRVGPITQFADNALRGTLLLQFDESKAISVALGSSGAVLDLHDGSTLSTLHGHRGLISAARMDGSTLVSGGVDTELRVWDMPANTCLRTLTGHTGEIVCLSMHKGTLVTGSEDSTLRVWSIRTGECLACISGHDGAVCSVQFDGKRIISGSVDGTVRVWDPATGENLFTFKGHNEPVYAVQSDSNVVISGSGDGSLKVWCLPMGKLLRTLEGHTGSVTCLQFDEEKIVSGSCDGAIKIWSRETGACLFTLKQHRGPVWGLKFREGRMMSSSFDKSLLMWNFEPEEEELPV